MNPKAILVEHREDYRAIYGLNLYVYLGLDVVFASTVKDAIKRIDESGTAMVFIDARAYSTDLALEIHNYLQKKSRDISLYIVGKTAVPVIEATVFDQKIQLKDILKSISKELKITAQQMASKVVSEYFPLPVDLLLPGSFCAAPLYRFSEGRYVEVFAGDKVITVEAVESLEDDDIDLLFVKRNVRLKFVNSITTQIFSKLNDPNLSVEDRVKATATAFQMTMERARAIGVTETTLELANVCIKSMHEIVEKIPALQKLLTVLFADTNGYRYQLCTLTSYIGGHIIKRMEWGSVEQQKKQTFVSFFAHIVLFKDEYLKYRSDEELDRSGLSEKEIVLIKNHALYGARMVSKLDKAPLGVDAIIKQHHGSKTGKSLSDLSLNISPLAIVYILAEEWAMNVLENHEKEVEEDAQTIMKKLKAKYSMPAFSKVFPALLELDL